MSHMGDSLLPGGIASVGSSSTRRSGAPHYVQAVKAITMLVDSGATEDNIDNVLSRRQNISCSTTPYSTSARKT